MSNEEKLLVAMAVQAAEDYIDDPDKGIIDYLRNDFLMNYIKPIALRIADLLEKNIETAKSAIYEYRVASEEVFG